MTKRAIFLLALFLLPLLAFGQEAQFNFSWIEGANPGWFPLTYEGTENGTRLQDGTVIRIYIDSDLSGLEGIVYTPEDERPVLGDGFREYNLNEFQFNASEFDYPPGSFYSPIVVINSNTPDNLYLYLVVCCNDQFGQCTPLYYSHPFLIHPGYESHDIFCPTGGPTDAPCWTLIEACDPPNSDCDPTPSPFIFVTTPGGHQGDEPTEAYCVDLCTTTTLEVQVGPLYGSEIPIVSVIAGCNLSTSGCSASCIPAEFNYNPDGWTYTAASGIWSNTIVPISDGCACIQLEEIEINFDGSFTAVPGDNEAELRWTTGSEQNLDYFELSRRSPGHSFEVFAAIPAVNNVNGSSYTYTDDAVNNCVRYEYRVTEVEINGSRTDWPVDAIVRPLAGLEDVTQTSLRPLFPNPVADTTVIMFELDFDAVVSLTVRDYNGITVAQPLVNVDYVAGRFQIEFDMTGLANGFYDVELLAGGSGYHRSLLKNTADPELLAGDAFVTTDAEGNFVIEDLHWQPVDRYDICFTSLGQVTPDGITLTATKTGYLPADTTIAPDAGSKHELNFILQSEN